MCTALIQTGVALGKNLDKNASNECYGEWKRNNIGFKCTHLEHTHSHTYTHTVLVCLSRKYFLINEDYCDQNISSYGPTTKEVQA